MNRDTVISKLEYICQYDYNNIASLFDVYIDIIQYQDYIKENISSDLYDSLHTELMCVYTESRLGDGEYGEMVYNNCIDVVKQVIKVL